MTLDNFSILIWLRFWNNFNNFRNNIWKYYSTTTVITLFILCFFSTIASAKTPTELLIDAIESHELAQVELILKNHRSEIDLDKKQNIYNSRTLLEIAIEEQSTEIVECLLNHGANIENDNGKIALSYGRFPIQFAILKGSAQTVSLLIKKGSLVSDDDLLHAASLGRCKMISSLVKAGANISNVLSKLYSVNNLSIASGLMQCLKESNRTMIQDLGAGDAKGSCLEAKVHVSPTAEYLAESIVPILHRYGIHDLDLWSVAEHLQVAQGLKSDPEASRGSDIASQVKPEMSVTEILELMLTHSNDLVIGESNHGDAAPKKALMENMSTLRKYNAAIALEHVPRVPYQQMWEQYFADSSPKSEMPKELADFLNIQDQGHAFDHNLLFTDPISKEGYRKPSAIDPEGRRMFGYYALVKAAKVNGVPLIFFETTGSKQAGFFGRGSSGPDRFAAMNIVEKTVVDRERKDRKIVHLVGSAHINYYEGIPGLSEMYHNAPTMVISETKEKRPNALASEVFGSGVTPDVHVIEGPVLAPVVSP